jgi:two-component SAPR family response regulator
MVTVVLVDDEKDWLDILKTMLVTTLEVDSGLDIKTFLKTDDAYDFVIKNKEDVVCIISDYLIPGSSTGLDFYFKIKELNINFILISNSKIPPDKIKEVVKEQIVYLPKSFLVVKNFAKKHLMEYLTPKVN